MLRVSISVLVLFAIWAGLFYFAIVDEVQEETDDVLEDYSAMLIQNFLAGESMPSNDNGSNNTYYIKPLNSHSLLESRRREGFSSEKMYIDYKKETEPARILRQVFRDRDDNYFELTVITPTIDEGDLIDAILQALIILFFLLLIAVLTINTLAVKGGLRPLLNLLNWLNKSNVETSSLPSTDEGNIQEIRKLSTAISGYASRSKRAFEQQKEFISNASHELQTPIAICQSRLELLLESELSEEQMKDIAECITTLSRLSKLNKTLLMLSRLENYTSAMESNSKKNIENALNESHGSYENETINFNEILQNNILLIQEIYDNRKISLSLEKECEIHLEANKELVSILLQNLLKNSFSHNVDGGEVRIKILKNSFVIENTGDGTALDSVKIFNRFYQGNSKAGSYGLGLPIVKSICNLYGFSIDYSFVNNLHRWVVGGLNN